MLDAPVSGGEPQGGGRDAGDHGRPEAQVFEQVKGTLLTMGSSWCTAAGSGAATSRSSPTRSWR